MSEKKATYFPVSELLIGLERSEKDKALLEYIAFFCGEIQPKGLALLHVVPADSDPIGVIYPPSTIALDPDFEEQLRTELDQASKPYLGDLDLPVHISIRAGAPLDQLVAEANDRTADLVAVGKRRGTTWHTILVKNMIRQLRTRVMMIPEGAKKKLETIFVPIDFSENSVRALQAALAIRASTGRDLRILAVNIYQRPDLMAFDLSMTADEFRHHVEANHQEGFRNFVSEHFPGREDQIEPLLIQHEDPDIAEVLDDQARENKADLVIMGARGHSKLAVLLLGSTTESFLSLNYLIPTIIVK